MQILLCDERKWYDEIVQGSPGYLRFLTRARRRWGVWRCLELGGICAALGAGIALLLMPILFIRGADSFEPSLILITFGAVAGLILGITRRPSISQTALRADQQLGLHDLLSTALISSKWNDASFSRVILAQAEAVCMRRSPSEIIVARLSRRAWGGIAVVGGLTLTLAMLLQGSPVTLADGLDDVGIVRAARVDSSAAISRSAAVEQIRSGANRLAESNQSPGASSSDSKAATSDADQNADRSRGDANSSASGNGTQSVDVAGSQEARTDDARVPTLTPGQSSTAVDQFSNGSLSAGGSRSVAGSIEQGDSNPAARDTRAGLNSAISSVPWTHSGPNLPQTHVETEIRSGKVPDSYRDLVREYFSTAP